MFNKLKKALKVCKDLDALEFTFDAHRSSLEGLPYKLDHPDGKYTIWTASGFWFTSLREVGGKCVDTNHAVSKFGVIGKILVWWKCQKHIRMWETVRYMIQESSNKALLDRIMED